ncbi:DNA-directed RNA polymerase III subunit RPC6 [Caerostris extrusa]|uniref:DNA-directed RNA polymerase III subunit RPC6 n=1 Tax=Caerostris extrusa TaxID=172846 RepID=A0AAV4QGZ4_CAEEX|nr:DNA-directed RNA polymerase III subunit RPC6 [Caerostris extrusa]
MAEQGSSNNEDMVLDILKRHPTGVTQKIFKESLPSLPVKDLVQIINKLSTNGKIDLLKKGKQLVYALKSDASRKTLTAGSGAEEHCILDAVKRAGNNGISPKELKFALNIPQPQITKILKNLESQRIVKAVTSSSKKKVFMLYNLEPSQEITGGTFYSGQEFETEFVDVIGEQCYQYLLRTVSFLFITL